MTREEEAIKRLKYIRAEYEEPLELNSREDARNSIQVYLDAIDMAIEALKRLISQKPYLWGDGYADGRLIYDMWDCPNCGKTYEVDYDEYDHCPACGQAIDWSE